MWNVLPMTSIWPNSVVINSLNWRLPLGAFIRAHTLGGNIVLNVALRSLNYAYIMCRSLSDVGPARKNTKPVPDTHGQTDPATMNTLQDLRRTYRRRGGSSSPPWNKWSGVGYQPGASDSLPLPRGPDWYEPSITWSASSVASRDEFIMLIRDITEYRWAGKQLRICEGRHRLLAENAMDVVWTIEPDGNISYVSPVIEKLRGLTPEEAMPQPLVANHPPDLLARSRGYFQEIHSRALAGLPLEPVRGELEYSCKDGYTVWCDVMVIPLVEPDGTLRQLLGVSWNISERKRHELELRQARDLTEQAIQTLQAANAELLRLATTDTLTGVWNRRFFETLVVTEIQHAGRYDEPLSLLLFDIDHFKAINDAHGHMAGDQVLIDLSHRVRDYLRSGDMLARWGGEEFVVMLRHCDGAEAQRLAERLRALIAAEPLPRVGRVTASFGVAEFRSPESADAWLNRVDDALYQAKAAGRNRVMFST